MSHEDEEQIVRSNAGGMVDHIQRYKSYINNLKKGQSSGISAAFGRASDLLPADIVEMKPPQTKPSLPAPELDDRVVSGNFDKNYLRQAMETIISDCAAALEDPIGTVLQTPYGELTVEDVFVEEGRRHFLLSDLRLIDEAEFQRWSGAETATSQEELAEDVGDFDDLEDEGIVTAVGDFGEDDDDEGIATTDSDFGEDDDEGIAAGEFDEDDDEGIATTDSALDEDEDEGIAAGEFDDDDDEGIGRDVSKDTAAFTQLTVTSGAGSFLWRIHFNGFDAERVEMFDGSAIQRAEGRDEHVLALRSSDGKDLKVYILSGFMVDPSTGNIFVEANEGVYTAAFLNNGWRVHQYRTHDRGDQFYVTEPSQFGREPVTMQVVNLNLNIETGEVSYETLDSAATITLRSRMLT